MAHDGNASGFDIDLDGFPASFPDDMALEQIINSSLLPGSATARIPTHNAARQGHALQSLADSSHIPPVFTGSQPGPSHYSLTTPSIPQQQSPPYPSSLYSHDPGQSFDANAAFSRQSAAGPGLSDFYTYDSSLRQITNGEASQERPVHRSSAQSVREAGGWLDHTGQSTPASITQWPWTSHNAAAPSRWQQPAEQLARPMPLQPPLAPRPRPQPVHSNAEEAQPSSPETLELNESHPQSSQSSSTIVRDTRPSYRDALVFQPPHRRRTDSPVTALNTTYRNRTPPRDQAPASRSAPIPSHSNGNRDKRTKDYRHTCGHGSHGAARHIDEVIASIGKATQWSCPHCDKRFSSKRLLKRHYEGLHWTDRLLICPICSQMVDYSKPAGGSAHDQADVDFCPWKCRYCPQDSPMSFFESSQLMPHFYKQHYFAISGERLHFLKRAEEAISAHFKEHADDGHAHIAKTLNTEKNHESFTIRDPWVDIPRFCQVSGRRLTGLTQVAICRASIEGKRLEERSSLATLYSTRIRQHLQSPEIRDAWQRLLRQKNEANHTEWLLHWPSDGMEPSFLLRSLELLPYHASPRAALQQRDSKVYYMTSPISADDLALRIRESGKFEGRRRPGESQLPRVA